MTPVGDKGFGALSGLANHQTVAILLKFVVNFEETDYSKMPLKHSPFEGYSQGRMGSDSFKHLSEPCKKLLKLFCSS